MLHYTQTRNISTSRLINRSKYRISVGFHFQHSSFFANQAFARCFAGVREPLGMEAGGAHVRIKIGVPRWKEKVNLYNFSSVFFSFAKFGELEQI